MKQISKFLLLPLLVLLTFPFAVFAQEDSSVSSLPASQPVPAGIATTEPSYIDPGYFPYSSYTPGIYMVTIFDKKGEATVVGKIIFDAQEKELLNDFNFIIPGHDIKLGQVVHEKYQTSKNCLPYYKRGIPLPTEGVTSIDESLSVGSAEEDMFPLPRADCYSEPTTLFTTLEPETGETREGLRVTVNARPNQSSKSQESILFLYRTNDYVKKLFTNRYFEIPTPLLPITSTTAQVGILVRDGMSLRGSYPGGEGGGGVYMFSVRALEKARNLFNERNQELTQLSNDIFYQGQIRKADSDISPDNSFQVTGVFGSNWLLLYMTEGLWIVVGIAMTVTLISLVIKQLFKNNLHLKTIIITSVISTIITLTIILVIIAVFFFGRFGWGYFPS